MKDSTKDKVEGKVEQAKGTMKEKAGQATHDKDLTSEGRGDKMGGKVQEKVGDAEKFFEK